MRNTARLVTGITAALMVISLVSPATAAVGARSAGAAIHSASAVTAAAQAHAAGVEQAGTCPSHLGQTFYCDYARTGFLSECLTVSGNDSNWGSCRNVDESFINNTNEYVRLWFGPNFGDPHACLNPGRAISNLAGFVFNSGSGAGAPIENNVASSTESTSKCTNPI